MVFGFPSASCREPNMHCNIVIPLHAFRPLLYSFPAFPTLPTFSVFTAIFSFRYFKEITFVGRLYASNPSIRIGDLATMAPWRMYVSFVWFSLFILKGPGLVGQFHSIESCIPANVGSKSTQLHKKFYPHCLRSRSRLLSVFVKPWHFNQSSSIRGCIHRFQQPE
jgi:hypothetical protein